MAAANVEAAIESDPDAMREHDPVDHLATVGDVLRLALALKGFILIDDPEAAKAQADVMLAESGAAQADRLN